MKMIMDAIVMVLVLSFFAFLAIGAFELRRTRRKEYELYKRAHRFRALTEFRMKLMMEDPGLFDTLPPFGYMLDSDLPLEKKYWTGTKTE